MPARACPPLTGDPRTDRALVALTRLLAEIAAGQSATAGALTGAHAAKQPPTTEQRRGRSDA